MKGHTVFDRSISGTVGSNLIQSLNVYPRRNRMFVLSCVGAGLGMARFPRKESYQMSEGVKVSEGNSLLELIIVKAYEP
jgi:hypothetical protein